MSIVNDAVNLKIFKNKNKIFSPTEFEHKNQNGQSAFKLFLLNLIIKKLKVITNL